MKISKKVQEQIATLRAFKRIPTANLQDKYKELYNLLPKDDYSKNKVLYILLYPDAEFRGECVECGENTTFENFNVGFRKFCSQSCSNKNEETLKRMKENHLAKYGVEKPMQRKEIMDKFCNTMKERHGVSYTAQSKKLSKKMENTLKENYGVTHPMHSKQIKERLTKTCIERSGCEHTGSAKSTIAKRKATMKERYGVEHSQQNRDIFEKTQKSSFSQKTIKIQGRTFKYQGYENHALELLAKSYDVRLIKTCAVDGIKSFPYTGSDKKTHVYHPDIQIGKIIFEVKSIYTAGLTKANSKSGLFSVLKRKGKAVKDAGFKFVLLLVLEDGRVITVRNIVDLTRKEVKALYE